MVTTFEREEVATLIEGTAEGGSPGVQARDSTLGAKNVKEGSWVLSSRNVSLGHIIMDQVVKGPLSIARTVLEANVLVGALSKELSESKNDSK